jgi:hypothetical protein
MRVQCRNSEWQIPIRYDRRLTSVYKRIDLVCLSYYYANGSQIHEFHHSTVHIW